MFRARGFVVPGLPPLDFEVAPGRVLGVSGPSGSGKTRLLRALADLDPAPGQVSLNGAVRETLPAPEWRRRVGLLPAEPRFWEPSVRDHFPADEGGSGDELGDDFLELGLSPDLADADPARLSTGERARIAVLRLLARRPAVVLLDEPTANLDRESRDRVVARLIRYVRERPAAGLWVSHRDDEIGIADRTLLLPSGEMRSPEEGAGS